jgi:hypothetical protein
MLCMKFHLCRRSLALAGVIGSGGGSGSDMRADSALRSAASGSDPYSDAGSGSASHASLSPNAARAGLRRHENGLRRYNVKREHGNPLWKQNRTGPAVMRARERAMSSSTEQHGSHTLPMHMFVCAVSPSCGALPAMRNSSVLACQPQQMILSRHESACSSRRMCVGRGSVGGEGALTGTWKAAPSPLSGSGGTRNEPFFSPLCSGAPASASYSASKGLLASSVMITPVL